MTHKTVLSVAAAAVAASAFATSAQVTDPLVTVSVSSALGSGSVSFNVADGAVVQPNGAIAFILFNTPLDIVDPNNNNVIATITQLISINNADDTTTTTSDPSSAISFAMFAGGADTDVTITASHIFTGSIVNAALRATAGITVTDNDGDGATLIGTGPGGTMHNTVYNGGTTFTDLITGPLIAGNTGSNSSSQDLPAAPGVFMPIANPLTDMQAQYNFNLSANDSASGTSGYFAIPAPASVVLLGFAGMTITRRRR